MKKCTVYWVLAGGFLAASCTSLVVGDGALRLRGQIVTGDRPARACTLELRLERTDVALAVRPVEGSFDLTFTVNPSPQRYYVHVWCQGHAATYDSPVFESRGLETFHEPVDLGTIQLSSPLQSRTNRSGSS